MKRAIVVWHRKVGDHQRTWGSDFAEGLRRHGWQVKVQEQTRPTEPCDLLVLWGVRQKDMIAAQKASGGEVCILERGYIGDRFKWASVSFGGGLNGRGEYRGPLDDPSRWEQHFARLMKPWRAPKNDLALIMGQIPADSAVSGVSLPNFYNAAFQAFSKAGFDVRVRPHPGTRHHVAERYVGLPTVSPQIPITDALADAAVVVTWNSNSAVDAVLAGVPAVAMDQGSMAWPVTGHDLTPPPMPHRDAWAHAMAWKQWTKDEMASGECWAAIGA